MKNFWNELDPRAKQWGSVILGLLCLMFFVSFFSSEPEESKRQNGQNKIRNILTNGGTRELGIDALSAEVKNLNKKNISLEKEFNRVNKELESTKAKIADSHNVTRDVDRLKKQMQDLEKKNRELSKQVVNAPNTTNSSVSTGQPSPTGSNSDTESSKAPWVTSDDPDAFFKQAQLPSGKKTNPADDGEGSEQSSSSRGIQIVSYSQPEPEQNTDDDKEKDDSLYLPAGSIITGVLINGMDAPTNTEARRNPFPSTVRIQREAILPNRFRADIKECFLIVSGYGDLSSERAYLRGETISCVRDDGGVIESKLDSYAVGEDGKAGLRGRVVSKQGQIIARSLMAGFLGGVSEAFDVNPVPTISTLPTGTTQFQSAFSEDLFQGAAVKGASKALDRVADFYIDMAEGIFPVIEIDAARQVDIFVTRGTKLQIR